MSGSADFDAVLHRCVECRNEEHIKNWDPWDLWKEFQCLGISYTFSMAIGRQYQGIWLDVNHIDMRVVKIFAKARRGSMMVVVKCQLE